MLRQFTGTPTWRDIVAKVAVSIGIPAQERANDAPAWKNEGAVLRKALADWEKLTPEERRELLTKAGADFGAVRGGTLTVLGAALGLGGEELLAFLATRGIGFLGVGTFFTPLALALGTLWTAYDLAGPS